IHAKPDSINDVILDVVNLYSMSYPHIEFDTSSLQPDLPRVALDKEQMNRVFVNIVSNAIAAVNERNEPGRIEFRTARMDNLNILRVEVTDNGDGIPAKAKDKVMEPYFSTKKDGTGLGLAIVSQIISEHGGYLRFSDRNPHGT